MGSVAIEVSNIAFLVVLLSLLLILKTGHKFRKLRLEQQKVIRNSFPDLSDRQFRKRNTELINYERVYLTSTPKRVLQEASAVLIVVSIGAMMFNGKIAFLCFGGAFIFVGLFALSLPKQREQKVFWDNYLKENPDNPINGYSIENPKIDLLARKLVIYFLVLGLALMALQVSRW